MIFLAFDILFGLVHVGDALGWETPFSMTSFQEVPPAFGVRMSLQSLYTFERNAYANVRDNAYA